MEKEKIKAEELRIGNYFYDSDNILCELVYFKPDKRGNYDLYCKLPNDKSIPLARTTTHYAKPIRLTEEWLIRFGFDNSVFNHIYRKGMIAVNIGNHMMITVNSKVIRQIDNKFVHTLQNLYFAIEQEELTLTPKE